MASGERRARRKLSHERGVRVLGVHQVVGPEVRRGGLGDDRARFGPEQ